MSIETRPSGNYRVVWRDENGEKQTRAFPKGQKEAAKAFDGKMASRKFEGTADAVVLGRATLDAYWSGEFADHLATKAPRTQKGYSQSYDAHIEPRLGNVPLVRLNLKRVRRFAADLERAGVKPSAADKAMSVLSAILGLAEADEAIVANPVPRLRRKRPKPRLVRPLAPETVEALRAKLDRRGRIIVSILAYAGLRPHELTGLRWRDVLDANLIVATGKTDDRSVRLLDPLKRDLAEWRLAQGRPDGDEYVVPATVERENADGGWTANGFEKWQQRDLKPAAEAVGRGELSAYYLRHSFASLLAHEGRSIVYIAAQLGHGPELSLRVYQHVISEFEDTPRLAAEDAIREAREKAREKSGLSATG